MFPPLLIIPIIPLLLPTKQHDPAQSNEVPNLICHCALVAIDLKSNLGQN